MSLTNDQITAKNFKEFYEKILPYLGGGSGGGGGGSYVAGDGIVIDNDEISTDNASSEDMNEIISPLPSVMSRRFKYSTEEQIVGRWIDGKLLYQKTLNCGYLRNNGVLSVEHGITDLSMFTNIYGVFVTPTGSYPIPHVSTTSLSYQVEVTAQDQYIYITTKDDKSGCYAYVTVQYTKLDEFENLIPNMTSATQPSGVVSASSANSSFPAWKAFDGTLIDSSDAWLTPNGTVPSVANPVTLEYKFDSATKINIVKVNNRKQGSTGDYHSIKDFIFQASNDNSNWTNLYTGTNNIKGSGSIWSFSFDNDVAYQYYRFYITSYNDAGHNIKLVSVGRVQMGYVVRIN